MFFFLLMGFGLGAVTTTIVLDETPPQVVFGAAEAGNNSLDLDTDRNLNNPKNTQE